MLAFTGGVAAAASAASPSSPAAGTPQYGQSSGYSNRGGGAWADRMIENAFQDALRRMPDDNELRRYRVRVFEDHWNADDIKNDLRGRRDYWSHSDRTTRDSGNYNLDRTIRQAYQDILGRAPDAEGLRHYRNLMMDQGWSERQLRDALRKSQEHVANPSASADRIINNAYRDLLGRTPDMSGMISYRNQIMYHGWDEHDVRQAIMNSPEYRQKGAGMNEAQAREVVRRAYLSVLGREPDPASAGFVQRVLRDHWTEREVARELRNSEEYRNRQQ
jgi:TorA maturation chaperone TorD